MAWRRIAPVLAAVVLLAGAVAAAKGAYNHFVDEKAQGTDPRFAQVITHLCDRARDDNDEAVKLGQSLRTAFAKAKSSTEAKRAAVGTLSILAGRAEDMAAALSATPPPADMKNNYNLASGALNRNATRMRWYSSQLEAAETPGEVTTVLRAARRRAAEAAADRSIARTSLQKLASGACDIGSTGTVDPIFAPRFYAATPKTSPGSTSQAGPQSRPSTSAPDPGAQATVPSKPGGVAARKASDGRDRKKQASQAVGQQGDPESETTTGDVDPPQQQLPLLPPGTGTATHGKGTPSTPVPAPTQTAAAPSPTPAPATTSPPTQTATATKPPPAPGYPEVTGGVTHTWSNYTNAGGDEGPTIPTNMSVQITCKVQGFRVADGNTWWYRVADSPWSNRFYASADAFYNNGQTSGSLHGTPFVDPAVPDC